MNGTRMNQFVAPTSFITSISRRRANIAVRIVFQISRMAASSRKIDSSRSRNPKKLCSCVIRLDLVLGEARRRTPRAARRTRPTPAQQLHVGVLGGHRP